MAGLEIKIGADSSELQAEISAAEAKIKRLGALKVERVKLGLDVKELNADINQAKSQLTSLNKAVATTGQSFSAMAPKVANGGNTLMQFSRIAQDAPFGIIGIGNNLTATAESFSYLKQQTGSTGGALKALAGSIMGTGGILLAVSLVTTAFTYMAQNGLTLGDVIDKMTGKFDANRRSMQEMNSEVAKNAQAQISSVGAYVYAAQNINLSMEQRLIAVRKLQDEYPAYFGNLSKEQILNGNVAGAVAQVTKALIEKAKATAYIDKVVKLSEQQEQTQSKINNAILEEVRIKGLNKKESFEAAKLINQVLRGNLTAQEAFNKASSTKVAYTVIQAQNTVLTELGDNLRNLIKLQEKYTDKVNETTSAQIGLEAKTTKADKVAKQEKYKNPNPNFNAGNGFLGGGIVNPNSGLVTPDLGADEDAINANEKLKAGLAMQKQTLADFNESASEIINGSIADTFYQLGANIGDALANGGNVLKAIGKSLLGSLGGILVELGKLAIQTGVGILAVKTSLKTLNPYVAIAAGAALVAIGGAFSSGASSLGSGGGRSGGGSVSTGSSVSSPTSSTSSGGSSSFTGGTVVFEISGQSLIGVLSNTLDKNRRLGGAISLG